MSSQMENELSGKKKESLHNEFANRSSDLSHISSGLKPLTLENKGFNFEERKYLLGKNEIASMKELENVVPRSERNAKEPKSRKRLYMGIMLLVLFLGALGFGYYKAFYMGGGTNIVKTEWGDIALDVPQSTDTVNVLALGFDKGGYRTDTMMIMSFNPKTKNINLISIPRDTLVGINGKRMKLNAAFAIGKFDLTLNTIRNITGMPIHYYVAVDTEGFKNIVDALGGVDFEVKRDMKYFDPSQNLNIDLKKGYQHLDGNRAEQLVRFRKYAMGDLDRENVQKDFIKSLIEQKLTLGNATDITKVRAVYDNLSMHVKTNVGFNDVMKYFLAAMQIKSESFRTYTLPGVPKNINGISYYVYDKKKTEELFKQIMGDMQPRYETAKGVETYDVEDLSKKSQSSTTGQTTTQKPTDKSVGSKTTKDSSDVEIIHINDGKDLSDDDIIKLEPIKPSKSTKPTQPKTTPDTTKGGTNSTNTDNSPPLIKDTDAPSSSISNTDGNTIVID